MSVAELIAAMRRPEIYPHRPPRVDLLQTHISYVFLAGDQVYKIKKAVRFSFLDFSTLEQRLHFCREEVRLNRRLAGDVYRGIVSIVADGAGGYRLDAEDADGALEYAVHMRRLPEDRLLDHLLANDQATPEMIDLAAARLAAFHRDAATGNDISANGSADALRAIMSDNFLGVRRFRGTTISAADDDAIQGFCGDFLQRETALLQRRQAGGRIRDGHGDLHAEHLCFADELIIFDCVEFNPRFRYCDVASDIAFLAMDLEYHGHEELADRLLRRYEELSGDRELAPLMPFYLCYRAYVRGKVGSLTSAEKEVSEAERREALDSARRHFALACRYVWRARPMLVMFSGLSGSGKSTIAAALAQRTGFTVISSDVIRKQLAGVPLESRPAEHGLDLYTAEQNARTYETMHQRCAQELACGRGVILDATYQRRAHRAIPRALATAAAVPLLMIECRCGEDEMRRRLHSRSQAGRGPSDADWGVHLEQRQQYEPFSTEEESLHLVIDTAQPVSPVVQAIESAMRRRLAF